MHACRMTERPTRIGPYMVPAGVPVATPLYAIHNTKHNWEEPSAFKPERWLGERGRGEVLPPWACVMRR